jgi:hypothetical protein
MKFSFKRKLSIDNFERIKKKFGSKSGEEIRKICIESKDAEEFCTSMGDDFWKDLIVASECKVENKPANMSSFYYFLECFDDKNLRDSLENKFKESYDKYVTNEKALYLNTNVIVNRLNSASNLAEYAKNSGNLDLYKKYEDLFKRHRNNLITDLREYTRRGKGYTEGHRKIMTFANINLSDINPSDI